MPVTIIGSRNGTSKSGKPYRQIYYTYSFNGVEGLATDSAFIFDESITFILGNDYRLFFNKGSNAVAGCVAL